LRAVFYLLLDSVLLLGRLASFWRIYEHLYLNFSFVYLLSKHSAVISKFGEYFVRTDKISSKYHRYLIDAEQMRLKGDYDRTERLESEDAKLVIQRAEEFLELLTYL
jgi:uncharacterized protein (UPF0332 family)